MTRQINFDMDGTIANFYGVENWLEYLINGDATPYKVARPLINFSSLARIIHRLQANGWKVCIISWLAKNSTEDFDDDVTIAKLAWLAKHLPSVEFDDITIVPYGTPKSTCGNGILFDDEEPNRKEWKGTAYDVDNIIKILKNLE